MKYKDEKRVREKFYTQWEGLSQINPVKYQTAIWGEDDRRWWEEMVGME